MRKRNVQKKFYVTPEEAAELKRKAVKAGLPESTYIRALIKGNKIKETPPPEFWQTMNRQLIGMANNVNQLVAKANTYGFIDVPMLQSEVERWRRFRAKYIRAIMGDDDKHR